MALDKIKTAMIEDDAVTLAKAANTIASVAEVNAVESDADKIQTNLALLAFKTAATGSLAKYSLKDQIIDEFVDATGIDATPSTNHVLASGVYSGESDATTSGGTATTHGSNTIRTITATGSTNFTTDATLTADILIVAGGGSGGGAGVSGGGGGGQVLYRSGVTLAVGSSPFAAVVGVGGVPSGVTPDSGDVSSFFGATANGGGHGASYNSVAADTSSIGSGGGGGGTDGANYSSGAASDATTPSGWTSYVQSGGSGEGDGASGAVHVGGGGGGATVAGTAGANASGGGNGGNGVSIANMGPSGATYLWAGGGGGGTYALQAGSGGTGGGGGGGRNDGTTNGAAGTGGIAAAETGQGDASGGNGGANTGSGGGGSAHDSQEGGNGGSGIVIIRYTGSAISDLILQSTDTAAETEADYADMVMLVEDAGTGVGTVNTHIKGWISEDSGVTFTQGTLVDEGDWGTNKRILAFHDLDISAQSGTAMCYKITTHSASTVYDTKIHATSIGWR